MTLTLTPYPATTAATDSEPIASATEAGNASPTFIASTTTANVTSTASMSTTAIPLVCPDLFHLVGITCYRVEDLGRKYISSTWAQDSDTCRGLQPTATLATFINQEEYAFLKGLQEYFMLNLVREADGRFVMMGRLDSGQVVLADCKSTSC